MDDQTTGRATEVMSNMVQGIITYEINPYYILNKQNNSKLEKPFQVNVPSKSLISKKFNQNDEVYFSSQVKNDVSLLSKLNSDGQTSEINNNLRQEDTLQKIN